MADTGVVNDYQIHLIDGKENLAIQDAVHILILKDRTIVLIIDKAKGQLRTRFENCTIASGGMEGDFPPFSQVTLRPGVSIEVNWKTGEQISIGMRYLVAAAI